MLEAGGGTQEACLSGFLRPASSFLLKKGIDEIKL